MRFVDERQRARSYVRRPLLSFSSFLLAIAVGIISSFTFSAAYDMARSAAIGGERRSFSGVWHGDWHGVRAVTIKLEQNNDAVSGTASFYRVVDTEDGPESSGQFPAITLTNPRLDGKRLIFELQSIDEIHPAVFIEMEMQFENEEEAGLRCIGPESEGSAEDRERIKMKRERSF